MADSLSKEKNVKKKMSKKRQNFLANPILVRTCGGGGGRCRTGAGASSGAGSGTGTGSGSGGGSC